jgi:hypothetical protein
MNFKQYLTVVHYRENLTFHSIHTVLNNQAFFGRDPDFEWEATPTDEYMFSTELEHEGDRKNQD